MTSLRQNKDDISRGRSRDVIDFTRKDHRLTIPHSPWYRDFNRLPPLSGGSRRLGNRYRPSKAAVQILETNLHLIPSVAIARLERIIGSAAPRHSWTCGTKERSEDIFGTAHTAGTTTECTTPKARIGISSSVDSGVTKSVVQCPLTFIRQHLVRPGNLIEGRPIPAGDLVGMSPDGTTTVCLLDFNLGSRLGYVQHFVVIGCG
mmetsp:Transcript_31548/g.69299  ORF Transcript_31548/g.69299 Transcript_31548/m.69299 type:complete len:204 (+) Transcript_31548:762-1373(+)